MTSFFSQFHSTEYTETEQFILSYFNQHIDTLPYMSLNDICHELYISNASIVRFCQKLGFNGFNELKYKLKNELHVSSDIHSPGKMLQHRISVFKDFIDIVDDIKIQNICSIILNSEFLYIYGRNMSSIPAKYLYSMLNIMDIPCIFIDWIDFLSALSTTLPDNATLIIYTNYGESTVYQPILNRCHQKNIRIVWISSSELSPELIHKDDIYIWTQEPHLKYIPLRTKMTSFIFTQIILEYIQELSEMPKTDI